MSTVVTRAGKGSPLTNNEHDANINNLNNDKYQAGNNASFGTLSSAGNATFAANTTIGSLVVTSTFNQNATSKYSIGNNSTGSAAQAEFVASADVNAVQFGVLGSGWTAAGVLQPSRAYAYTSFGLSFVSNAVGSDIRFAAGGTTEVMRITSAGVELTQGQIKFPATQTPSSDVNTLDDYEERQTFTPTATFGGASVGITYSLQQGEVTKIGNEVMGTLRVTFTNKGSSTGALQIAGLPYTSRASLFPRVSAFVNAGGSGITNLSASFINAANTIITIAAQGAAGGTNLTDANATNTFDILVDFKYTV